MQLSLRTQHIPKVLLPRDIITSDEGSLPGLKELLIYSPEKVALKGDAYFP